MIFRVHSAFSCAVEKGARFKVHLKVLVKIFYAGDYDGMEVFVSLNKDDIMQ